MPRKADRSAPTSYDVALAAGVSQSSVSRAFDPAAPIKPALRKRVMAAASALGWRPNSIASSLQKRRTEFIGLITSELSSPWRAQQLAALLPALEKSGHRALMFQTDREGDIDDLIDQVLSYQGRAVIVGAGLMSARIAKVCARSGLLVILLNRWSTAAGVAPIACDHRLGGRMAVDYLAGRGCRRLCFLQGNPDSYAGQQRELGFRERCAEHAVEAEVLEMGSFERDCGRRAAEILATRSAGSRPEGVLAANDAMALGMLDHAYATGQFTPPRDFALVGFDDLAEAAAPAYQITTIRQPIEALTAEVVSLLDQWRDAAGAAPVAKARILAPRLVERRTGLWNPQTP